MIDSQKTNTEKVMALIQELIDVEDLIDEVHAVMGITPLEWGVPHNETLELLAESKVQIKKRLDGLTI